MRPVANVGSVFIVAVVAVAFVFAFAAPDAAHAQNDTEASYTSPAYGFSVSWNPEDWTFIELGQRSDSFNSLELESASTEDSELRIFGGAGYGGEPDACLSDFDEHIRSDEFVTDVQLVESAAQMLDTGNSEGAAALYMYVLDLSFSEPTPYAHYVECRTMVQGESTLSIEWEVPREGFEAGLASFEGVMSTMAFTDPVDQNSALRGVYPDGYTNPRWAYSVPWDESSWSLEAIDHGLSYLHSVELEGGDSYVGIEAEGYDYETEEKLSPESCIQEELDSLESYNDVSDIEVSRDPADFPTGVDGSSAAVLMSYTVADDDGTSDYTDYVECRSIDDGLAVLLIFVSTSADGYDGDRAAIASLLEGITVPGE